MTDKSLLEHFMYTSINETGGSNDNEEKHWDLHPKSKFWVF